MNIYELWLIVANISNESKIMLMEQYNNEENIYNNIENIIIKAYLRGKEGERLKKTTLEEGYKLKKYIEKENIEYITISNIKYPNKLRTISNPPYVLFYKGNYDFIYDNMVGIVGSRKNTTYGEQVTKIIVNELLNTDYGVISGVADGIDSVAHKSMLANGGKTIGVLGCGIDVVYPKINRNLYKRIEEEGLLLSEFIPGTSPFSYNFPKRNMIKSGLSKGVIVIEADYKSGSLITARYAAEQGRDVMAIPGSILNGKSRGCNKLLEVGAKIFVEIDDLYRFLNIAKNNKKNKEEKVIYSKILELINDEPIHIDKIINNVKVDRMALFELLFEMQNKNEIICLPGNYYAKLS